MPENSRCWEQGCDDVTCFICSPLHDVSGGPFESVEVIFSHLSLVAVGLNFHIVFKDDTDHC